MVNLDKLSEYLKKSDANTIVLTFREIESILESELPVEAKRTAKWWWNVKDSKKAKSWLDYGYETLDQKNIPARGCVYFRRIIKKPELQKGFSRKWYFLTDRDAELHQKVMAVLEIFVIPVVTILTLIIAIATLYITIFPVESQDQIRENFTNLIIEGYFEFKNWNFLDAADYYHKASLASYDIDSAAYSQHREGMCYMLYGLIDVYGSSDMYYGLGENEKKYLRRALIIFENITNTPGHENTQGFQEAIIDLSSLYRFLGYDPEDEKWYSIVKQLEARFNFDDLEDISVEDIPTFISASVNLSYYYKAIIYTDPHTLLFNEDAQEKAIYYSRASSQLMKKLDEYRGIKNYDQTYYDQTYLVSIYDLTSYMIINAFTHPKDKDNFFEILEEARTLCQDAILTIHLEHENIFQLTLYTELKTNIGKTYIFSSWASESPDKENYMLKAYQELISLFYWDDYAVTANIIIVSEYILLTEQCTEDDIQLILEKLSLHLQTARKNKNIPAQISIELVALGVCNSILLYYDYETISFNAQDFGQQLYTDLNTLLFDFLDSNQKEILAIYSKRFGA